MLRYGGMGDNRVIDHVVISYPAKGINSNMAA